MKCPNCKTETEHVSHEPPEAHLHVGVTTHWCPKCGTMCKAWDLQDKVLRNSTKIPKGIKSKPAKKKPTKLTVGMRARFKVQEVKNHSWSDCGGCDCLLEKRSQDSFSVMILGQKQLKKKDPKTVVGGVAWVNEEDLEWVDSNFKANMEFIDWYEEHEEEFCGDCGAWFPDNGCYDKKTGKDTVCPNEKCPGRLYDAGICPSCETPVPEDKSRCPKCDFNMDNPHDW